jgi:hypothetical protein
MIQAQVRIRDGRSAANVYAVMTTLGAPAKLPVDAAELTAQLKRISGRGRQLAIALQAFVDEKGFDTLVEAMERNRANRERLVQSPAADQRVLSGSPHVAARAYAEAAATPGSLNLKEPKSAALMFASSGMY